MLIESIFPGQLFISEHETLMTGDISIDVAWRIPLLVFRNIREQEQWSVCIVIVEFLVISYNSIMQSCELIFVGWKEARQYRKIVELLTNTTLNKLIRNVRSYNVIIDKALSIMFGTECLGRAASPMKACEILILCQPIGRRKRHHLQCTNLLCRFNRQCAVQSLVAEYVILNRNVPSVWRWTTRRDVLCCTGTGRTISGKLSFANIHISMGSTTAGISAIVQPINQPTLAWKAFKIIEVAFTLVVSLYNEFDTQWK